MAKIFFDRLMITDTEKVFKNKLAAFAIDLYEIYLTEVESTSVEVKDQTVESFTSSQSRGLSLRVLKEGCVGFSYCTEFTDSALDKVISDAVVSAQNSSSDGYYGFPEISKPLPTLKLFDYTLPSISREEKIARAMMLENAALSCDRRITKVRKAAYSDSIVTSHLINSHGLNLSHQGTFTSCSIVAVAEEEGDSQMGWDFDFNRFYCDLDVTKVGRSAASKALGLLGAQSVTSFKGSVVLDNSVSAQFLGVLAPSFLAESVQKNKSLLKGKLNNKLFSDSIDIIDDGLYPGGAATKPFDGEGVVRQTTPLVEQGVLTHFLYDTYCAKKDNTISTGNSSRGSIKFPPGVGHTNLYLKKGEETVDELISSVDKGLLINEVMGIHTANPISGDFSVGVNGHLIVNGKNSTPVKGVAISGNIVSLLGLVKKVGCDFRFYGSIGAPSLLIDEVEVSGS